MGGFTTGRCRGRRRARQRQHGGSRTAARDPVVCLGSRVSGSEMHLHRIGKWSRILLAFFFVFFLIGLGQAVWRGRRRSEQHACQFCAK